MTFDDISNFGLGVIQTPPSPALSGNSFTLIGGQGNNFPAVVNGYNLIVWPNPQTLPSKTNAEIVRVTAKSTDIFTITRTQESSTARAIQQGDYVALAPTKAVWQAIYNAINGLPTFPGGTVQGSIPFYSAANVLAALAPGTAGKILQSNGPSANPSWVTPAAAGALTYQRILASDASGFTTFRAVGGLTYTFTPAQNCHVAIDALLNLVAAGSSGITNANVNVDGSDISDEYPQHSNNTDTFTMNITDVVDLTGGSPHTIIIKLGSTGSSVALNGNRGVMRLLIFN